MLMADLVDTIRASEPHLYKVSNVLHITKSIIISCLVMSNIRSSTGPVARFGDTAANAGILALLQSNSYLSHLPSLGKTVFASLWYTHTRVLPNNLQDSYC